MKRKNLFKLRPLDGILLAMTTMVVLFSLFIVTLISPPSGNIVEIIYDGTTYSRLDINTDTEITLKANDFDLLLGDIVIEVKGSKVRIKEETSPNNICSHQGWTDNQYKILICEPNSLIIRIVNDNEYVIPDEIPPGGLT